MPYYTLTPQMEIAGYAWVNHFKVEAATLDAAVAGVPALVGFMQTTLCVGATIFNVHVNRTPNTSGQEFTNVPQDEFGTYNVAYASMAGAEMCYFLKIGTATGYPGKKFLRYAIAKADFSPAGKGYVVSNQARVDAIVAGWNLLLESWDEVALKLVIGKANRNATEAVSVSIKTLDPEHGWYNRLPGPR